MPVVEAVTVTGGGSSLARSAGSVPERQEGRHQTMRRTHGRPDRHHASTGFVGRITPAEAARADSVQRAVAVLFDGPPEEIDPTEALPVAVLAHAIEVGSVSQRLKVSCSEEQT